MMLPSGAVTRTQLSPLKLTARSPAATGACARWGSGAIDATSGSGCTRVRALPSADSSDCGRVRVAVPSSGTASLAPPSRWDRVASQTGTAIVAVIST